MFLDAGLFHGPPGSARQSVHVVQRPLPVGPEDTVLSAQSVHVIGLEEHRENNDKQSVHVIGLEEHRENHDKQSVHVIGLEDRETEKTMINSLYTS